MDKNISFMDRVQIGFKAARAAVSPQTAAVVEQVVDAALVEVEQKQRKRKSKLDVRDTKRDLAYYTLYNYLRAWVNVNRDEIADYGDPARDLYLSKLWRVEPIMAGAVYSMTAKMTALRWSITGRARPAKMA